MAPRPSDMNSVQERARQLGADLRRRRVAAGLTQQALAARIGYDRSYLSQVETGGERLLRQPSREPSTAQVGAESPRAFLHGTQVGRSGGHAATPTPLCGRMWVIYVGSRQPRIGRVVMKRL